MDAMQRGDVEAVVAMLAEDAAWSMPPLASWYGGREALTTFLKVGPLSGEWRWRHVPAHANGQPAVGVYSWGAEGATYRPFAPHVPTPPGARLQEGTPLIGRATP